MTAKDEYLLASWHIAHGWPPLPASQWPRHGFLIGNENGPLVAGFVYETDGPMAWLENIVAKPDSDKIERRQAVDMLIKAAQSHCQARGYGLLYCLTKHPRIVEALKEHGLTALDENVSILAGRT